MDEHTIVRSMLLRIGRGVPATAGLAKAIAEWAQPHADWLLAAAPGEDFGWDRLLAGLEQARLQDAPEPQALRLADELARLLGLGPVDATLLTLMVACDRLQRIRSLAELVSRQGRDLPTLLGVLAGAEPQDAERAVRQSPVLRLGLVNFVADWQGVVEVDIRWPLERLLDRAPASGAEIIDALVGTRQQAALTLDDFAHVADADFLVRLLRGAVRERARGINILIHGPPGTGKTEFARALAATAHVEMRGVAEADEDDNEPTRNERVGALRLAQRLLGPSGGAALLFDEMEDFIGDSQRSEGDWFSKREGSKVFVNRMLETNAVPVIWTTNAIGNIDDAILRRMSFVLKLAPPPRKAALRILDRIAHDEGVTPGDGLDRKSVV